MQRIRVVVSLVALLATITLGLCWNTSLVIAEGTPECNCIDGFTNRDGVYGWDPAQQRNRCITGGCYVITEENSLPSKPNS
jgi:hypothetical protein